MSSFVLPRFLSSIPLSSCCRSCGLLRLFSMFSIVSPFLLYLISFSVVLYGALFMPLALSRNFLLCTVVSHAGAPISSPCRWARQFRYFTQMIFEPLSLVQVSSSQLVASQWTSVMQNCFCHWIHYTNKISHQSNVVLQGYAKHLSLLLWVCTQVQKVLTSFNMRDELIWRTQCCV